VVCQNPPFGVQEAHVDRIFLACAFGISPLVYSFHKYVTRRFIEAFAEHHGFSVQEVYRYPFPLPAQFSHHRSRLKRIDVGCWCFIQN